MVLLVHPPLEPIKLAGITPTVELSISPQNIDIVILRFRHQHRPQSVGILGLATIKEEWKVPQPRMRPSGGKKKKKDPHFNEQKKKARTCIHSKQIPLPITGPFPITKLKKLGTEFPADLGDDYSGLQSVSPF